MRHLDLSELGLLSVFLATAVAFIALTFDFRSSSAALFPRLMGSVVVVGVVLLLVREYLPEPLRRVVAEPVTLVDRDEFGEDADEALEADADERERERPLTPRQFTFVAITAYVGLSYLASILVATPAFVLAYALWFKHRWTMALLLTGIALVIVFLFIELANAPLDDGLLLPSGGL